MTQRLQQLQRALAEKSMIKVISGIANFDIEQILRVARAAEAAGATCVDVAAKKEIIEAVRLEVSCPVFASTVSPEALQEAFDAGADGLEVGNYDALYEQGLFFTVDDVLRLAKRAVEIAQGQAMVSVTIPGHLSLDSQERLARTLETLGVDVIQTEGASRALSAVPQIKTLTADEKASITLHNTQHLSKHTSIPVMAASGIATTNIAEAFQAGAAAVGVGSAVNKLETETEMVHVLRDMMARVSEHSDVQPAMTQVS